MEDETSMLSCSSNHIAPSIYNLTLDEVQALLGKPLSSISLEELLRSVISADESHNHHHHQHNLNLSPASSSSSSPVSFNLDTTAGKRTVEEVWREIAHQPQPQPQQQVMGMGMGETTLEVFLVRAGIMSSHSQQSEWYQFQAGQHMAALDCNFNYCIRMEAREEERERRYSDEVIERRQKRMIKNRESAARSRARKQAYTNQLEHQLLRLRKTNNCLRKNKEIERFLVSTSPSEPRYQLRRTTSATF